jgi:hypothetical protein
MAYRATVHQFAPLLWSFDEASHGKPESCTTEERGEGEGNNWWIFNRCPAFSSKTNNGISHKSK